MQMGLLLSGPLQLGRIKCYTPSVRPSVRHVLLIFSKQEIHRKHSAGQE